MPSPQLNPDRASASGTDDETYVSEFSQNPREEETMKEPNEPLDFEAELDSDYEAELYHGYDDYPDALWLADDLHLQPVPIVKRTARFVYVEFWPDDASPGLSQTCRLDRQQLETKGRTYHRPTGLLFFTTQRAAVNLLHTDQQWYHRGSR
jgi:hypothetical protein